MNKTLEAEPVSSVSLHRIANALLFATCGDALAGPFNGNRLPTPSAVEDLLRAPSAALPLSRALSQGVVFAEHLAHTRGLMDEDRLVLELIQDQKLREPEPVPSSGAQTLAAIAAGVPWREAAAARHGNQGSYGSTAGVRAIAAGLVPNASLRAASTLARRSAALTHAHPLAHDAAAAIATAVSLAMRGHPSSGQDPRTFLAAVASQVHHGEFRAALEFSRSLVRHRAGSAEIAATVGHGTTALRSVPAALTAYLRHPADPRAAIRLAIGIGGNTRAIAAITGALVGAHCPEAEVPVGWRRLTQRGRIRAITIGLANIDGAGLAHT